MITSSIIDPSNSTPFYDQSLVEGLIKEGLNAKILTSPFQYGKEKQKPYEKYFFYDLANNLKLHGQLRRIVCGFEHIPGWLKVIRAIKNEKQTQIVHTQWLPLPLVDLYFLKIIKSLHVPFVHTVHNLLPHKEGSKDKKGYWHIYDLADQLIVHTEKTTQGLIEEFGINPDKINLIPCGLIGENQKTISKNEANILLNIDNRPTVLFFGSLRVEKGIQSLIYAFSDLIKIIPEARLMVVGKPEGISEKKIIGWVKERNIPSSQIYTRIEYIPESEVPIYFCAANCVVYPYEKIDQSGALILGLTLGSPVIVTSVGGMPDIVKDRVTGLVVPPKNVAALTQAMEELLLNPTVAAEYGRNAMLFVKDNFGWDTIAKKTIEVYKKVLSF